MLRAIDPRRSLVAGAMILIVALAVACSIGAALWVGGIARENVVEQHVRRLSLETDQLSSDLGQAMAARLGAVGTVGTLLGATAPADRRLGLNKAFQDLVSAYPEFDWIAVTDDAGTVVSSNGTFSPGSNVAASVWYIGGLRGPWIGVIGDRDILPMALPAPAFSQVSSLGDMAIPLQDGGGRPLGVVAAHLSWRRTPNHAQRLTDEPDSHSLTAAYVLNRANLVLIGPADSRGKTVEWDSDGRRHPRCGYQRGGHGRRSGVRTSHRWSPRPRGTGALKRGEGVGAAGTSSPAERAE